MIVLFAAACGSSPKTSPDGPTADAAPPDADFTNRCQTPAAGDGITCDIQDGSADSIMFRGDVVQTDGVWTDSAVVVQGDSIVCVGCDCIDNPAYQDATRVECAGMTVSPALINAHDHLSFTEGEPHSFGTQKFNHRHEWRLNSNLPRNPHGTGQDSAGMRWGELRMVMGGATSIVGAGHANGMLRNLDRLSDAQESKGLREVEADTFSLGDASGNFRQSCNWNYAVTEREAAAEPAYLPHIAEGINDNALEEFRCQSSSFNGGQDFTESNAAHVHSIGLRTEDYFEMAYNQTKLVWSPRTNISLYGMTAQVTIFDNLGGTIALGTDWTYSGSANMQRELQCADSYNKNYLDGYFSDRQLLDMATINGARATGNDHLLGSLEAGKLADIAIFSGNQEPLRRVLESTNASVELVMRDGQPLFGNSDVVKATGRDCESVNVCGGRRAICATQEFAGESFASVAADVGSGNAAYPAIFCGTPQDEPSCEPTRPGAYNGISANDSDGDGHPNDDDNCPTVFNPVRPIDTNGQPDSDQDGIGDACDETILSPDMDGDGVDNLADNCPLQSNPNQDDQDSDSKGDDCDFCPNAANPNSICPVAGATIVAIRNGMVSNGQAVTVTDVVVTATFDEGLTVQDPNAASVQYSGIWVFVGSNPNVSIGDIVTVFGQVSDYYGLAEIGNAQLTITGSTTPIAPTVVSVTDAVTEPYESVLLEISSGTVTDTNYDCTADNANCSDTNLWEMDSTLLVWDKLYGGNNWSSLAGTFPVVGIGHYRFDRRRLLPRSDSDFGN